MLPPLRLNSEKWFRLPPDQREKVRAQARPEVAAEIDRLEAERVALETARPSPNAVRALDPEVLRDWVGRDVVLRLNAPGLGDVLAGRLAGVERLPDKGHRLHFASFAPRRTVAACGEHEWPIVPLGSDRTLDLGVADPWGERTLRAVAASSDEIVLPPPLRPEVLARRLAWAQHDREVLECRAVLAGSFSAGLPEAAGLRREGYSGVDPFVVVEQLLIYEALPRGLAQLGRDIAHVGSRPYQAYARLKQLQEGEPLEDVESGFADSVRVLGAFLRVCDATTPEPQRHGPALARLFLDSAAFPASVAGGDSNVQDAIEQFLGDGSPIPARWDSARFTREERAGKMRVVLRESAARELEESRGVFVGMRVTPEDRCPAGIRGVDGRSTLDVFFSRYAELVAATFDGPVDA